MQGICERCKETTELEWKSKITGNIICGRCYFYMFSYFSLTTKEFIRELKDAFPTLSPSHKGYYAGVSKFASQMFKSWLSKVDDRKYDIEQLMINLQAETNPKKQMRIREVLKEKQKGIKNLEFGKNVIYLGNAGMFILKSSSSIRKEIQDYRKKQEEKKEKNVDDLIREKFAGYPELESAMNDDGQGFNENYYIGFTSPTEKRSRRWYELRLGNEEDYTSEHNKIKLVKNSIADPMEKYRSGFGKLLLGHDGRVEFMFPKEDISTSMGSNKEIENFMKANPENPIVSLSFGVKRPINMVAFRAGKIVELKSFGSPAFWHRINRDRRYRDRVARTFSKYNKWKKRKARRRFSKKRGDSERKFIRFYCHKLTREVISHVKKNYPNAVIVMQDLKNIKKISYPKNYMVVLTRWAVEMQRNFLEYKEKLKNLHTYLIPYKQSNNLTCSRCNSVAKDGKKTIKTLTIKLDHGSDRIPFLKSRVKMLSEKTEKLLKYPQTKDNNRNMWLQKTSEELTRYKQMLMEKQKQVMTQFRCDSCNYTQDFYTNEAICLYNILNNAKSEIPAQHSERMRDGAEARSQS